jgi:hypothetical protein
MPASLPQEWAKCSANAANGDWGAVKWLLSCWVAELLGLEVSQSRGFAVFGFGRCGYQERGGLT